MEPNLDQKSKLSDQHDKYVAALAGELHEQWRQTRLDDKSGQYEPRVKTTADEAWIVAHDGTTEVDIANTSYDDLPADWQAENRASAEVSITEVERAKNSGVVDLDSDDFLDSVSDTVHQAWLERNASWAPAEQNKPYAELSEDEKEKDRAIVKLAIRIVTGQDHPKEFILQ